MSADNFRKIITFEISSRVELWATARGTLANLHLEWAKIDRVRGLRHAFPNKPPDRLVVTI